MKYVIISVQLIDLISTMKVLQTQENSFWRKIGFMLPLMKFKRKKWMVKLK